MKTYLLVMTLSVSTIFCGDKLSRNPMNYFGGGELGMPRGRMTCFERCILEGRSEDTCYRRCEPSVSGGSRPTSGWINEISKKLALIAKTPTSAPNPMFWQ
jgi:hypothetical protein